MERVRKIWNLGTNSGTSVQILEHILFFVSRYCASGLFDPKISEYN
jgi:hypothetical protein